VQAVLNKYRTAFSDLDSVAAKMVWPSVDARALDRAFAQIQSQDVQFTRCRISVTGTSALADCDGYAAFVPKVGNKTPRQQPRAWTFNLEKSDTEWTIQRVVAR